MTPNHDRNAERTLAAAPSSSEPAGRSIDRAALQRAAAELLSALGADPTSEALRETPRRVADAYCELLTSQPFRATSFPNDEGYDELVVAQPTPFHSPPSH